MATMRRADLPASHFRDRLIAAPLKLRHLEGMIHADVRFPRSIDRGPIEACKPTPASWPLLSFPRSIDRGPIEARQGVRACRCWRALFPRSIDRGPIEAAIIDAPPTILSFISAID